MHDMQQDLKRKGQISDDLKENIVLKLCFKGGIKRLNSLNRQIGVRERKSSKKKEEHSKQGK